MDSKMAPAPAIIDPVRNDWRPRQLLKIGLAILDGCCSALTIYKRELTENRNQRLEMNPF